MTITTVPFAARRVSHLRNGTESRRSGHDDHDNVVAGFVTGTVALGASVAVGERTAFAVLLGLACVGLAIGRWRGRDRSGPVLRTAAAGRRERGVDRPVTARAGHRWSAVAGRQAGRSSAVVHRPVAATRCRPA